MQSKQAPYDEYRFFEDVECRPNYGGGLGSFVPKYNRTITAVPLVIWWKAHACSILMFYRKEG